MAKSAVEALPERRRIVVVSGEHRVDLAVPLGDTLAEAFRGIGFPIEPGRHVVLDRSGAETHLSTRGSDLADGSLLSLIDLRARSLSNLPVVGGDPLRDRGAIWWMLAMVAVVTLGVHVLGTGPGRTDPALQRGLASAALGVAAIVSALVWARRHPHDVTLGALSMLSPLTLAFASGFVMIPLTMAAGLHLAVVCGLAFAAVLAALLTVTIGGLRLRSFSGVTTVILVVLAAIWGITLLSGMGVAAAAVISAGAVPLGLRILPSTLVNVDEGYLIDHEKFMSTRWTVRGAVPHTPTEIRADNVGAVVEDSSARLLAGTVLLSGIPVLVVPLAADADWQANPLVLGGAIGLLSSLVIALLLIARHTASPALRWVPRGAAVLVLVEATAAAALTVGSLTLTVAAAGFLVVGIFAAVLLVPIGRGARSLVWSRLADVLEALAIALSLPSALLAADIVSILRGMMAA